MEYIYVSLVRLNPEVNLGRNTVDPKTEIPKVQQLLDWQIETRSSNEAICEGCMWTSDA